METHSDLPEQNPNTPGSVPPRLPTASWWGLATVLAAGLILGIGGLELLRLLARPLALLILAASIAAALAPVVERLSARMPRMVAVILVYVVLVLIIAGILVATVPLLLAQLRTIFTTYHTWLPRITGWIAQFGFDTSSLFNALLSEAGRLVGAVIFLPFNLATGLLEIFLILFLSLYWLITMPQLKLFFLSFFPLEEKPLVGQLVGHMGQAMGGYLRGAAINGLIIGVLEYLGLLVIGVPYALTLAALSGFMEFFPTIGPIISGSIATLVALSISPHTALFTAIYATVLQQAEGHILVPLIMRSQTEISPLLAIFAVVSGAAVGGLLGAVVAIPIASALHLLVKRVIAPAIRRANGVRAEEVDKA